MGMFIEWFSINESYVFYFGIIFNSLLQRTSRGIYRGHVIPWNVHLVLQIAFFIFKLVVTVINFGTLTSKSSNRKIVYWIQCSDWLYFSNMSTQKFDDGKTWTPWLSERVRKTQPESWFPVVYVDFLWYILISWGVCWFPVVYMLIFCGICWFPGVYVDFLWDMLISCCICWFPVVYVDFLWYMLISCSKCWFPVVYVDFLWYMLISCGICWFPIVYVDFLWYMLISCGICWFLMVYVDFL